MIKRPNSDQQARLREYALLAPRLGQLLWRLLRDPRVPARNKAALLFVAAYLASPVDLIPDFIAGLGQADDVVLAAFALDQILNQIPDDIVREHWEGDGDVLEVVKQILDISTAFFPRWLKRLVTRD